MKNTFALVALFLWLFVHGSPVVAAERRSEERANAWYAGQQMHSELARLRTELKVPAADPPGAKGQSDTTSGAKKGKSRAKAKQ